MRELLAAVAVAAIGLAVLAPAIRRWREQALRQQCVLHMKTIGLALLSYHDVYARFPPGIVAERADVRSGHQTAHAMLLPFLDQPRIYNEVNFRLTWSHAANRTAIGRPIEVYVCPANRGVQLLAGAGVTAAVTDYGWCKGAATFLCLSPRQRRLSEAS
jgi:type II secretory pathway pseudopilin PulG